MAIAEVMPPLTVVSGVCCRNAGAHPSSAGPPPLPLLKRSPSPARFCHSPFVRRSCLRSSMLCKAPNRCFH
eukprot:scaffold113565_cov21-Tisochrysis_lutea.AAC.3